VRHDLLFHSLYALKLSLGRCRRRRIFNIRAMDAPLFAQPCRLLSLPDELKLHIVNYASIPSTSKLSVANNYSLIRAETSITYREHVASSRMLPWPGSTIQWIWTYPWEGYQKSLAHRSSESQSHSRSET